MSNKTNRLAFNVAFCGIITALGVVIMFGSLIPSLAYAVPALTGMCIWTISEQVNTKWAYLSYGAVTLLSFMLIPELEADFFLLTFFGYYPTLCIVLDRIKNKFLKFIIKLGIFNAAIVLTYQILVIVLSAEEMLEGLEEFGQYGVYIFWGVGNIAFVIYDFCMVVIKECYIKAIKPKINKMLK